MSEQTPKSEKWKPLKEQCGNCDSKYTLDNENTTLFMFEKDRTYNHIICRCPQCEAGAFYFMDDAYQEHAIGIGLVPVTPSLYAPSKVVEMWEKLRGVEQPPTYELTDRQEGLVGNLSQTLDTLLRTDPDLFWDTMNDPNDFRPHNQRWT